MKKLRWLVVLAAMLFATAANADGIDVKVKGTWDFVFGWATNQSDGFHGGRYDTRADDNFIARQRVRTQINFITSEYLQGVLMFEIGMTEWGRDGGSKNGPASGGGLDADGVNVKTKRAFLDWLIPNTEVSVRMGIQGVSLPMANGYCNPVFSADVAGIVVNSPITDMFGVTAFWLRPFNRQLNDGADNRGFGDHLEDEMDIVGLALPITGDGWSVTPWGMYARNGNASNYYEYISSYWGTADNYIGQGDDNSSANGWWLGLSAQVDIWDPLTFGFDVMYGRMGKANVGLYNMGDDPTRANMLGSGDAGTRGWFFDAALNYKLDWGTPGIFGWYATGDNRDDVEDGQFGRMPVVGVDDGFTPTSFGFSGSYSGISSNGAITYTGMGTWGIGLQIADMSFIQDLSHTLRVAYYQGTNDHKIIRDLGGADAIPHLSAENIYLTDKDRVWEVNFDHQYKIYENLTAVLELGYINLHLDDDTWTEHKTDDAWKAQVIFRYQF